MLVEQFIEIGISGSNVNHYRNLGYNIPTYKDNEYRVKIKKGTKIFVNVFDLPKYSEVNVIVKCDNCNKEYPKIYSNYIRDLNTNANREFIDLCFECSHKLRGKNKLLNFEYVYNYYQSKGCILLSKEYLGTKDNYDYVCKCGKIYSKTFNSFRSSYMCDECSNKSRIYSLTKYTEEFVKDYLNNNNCVLLSPWINISIPIEFICSCGNIGKTSFSHFLNGDRCHECAVLKRCGENNCNWNGGISKLIVYLKNKSIKEWKEKSMQGCNYKCVVTGKRFDDIHHLHSFDMILKETIDELDFKIKQNIGEYNFEELQLLEKTLLQNHYKYPLGVCLTREIHKEFHNKYGYGNNTPEQFQEFLNNNNINIMEDYKVV